MVLVTASGVARSSDPKVGALDGLNLSRAWMLAGYRCGFARSDKRLPRILAARSNTSVPGLAG